MTAGGALAGPLLQRWRTEIHAQSQVFTWGGGTDALRWPPAHPPEEGPLGEGRARPGEGLLTPGGPGTPLSFPFV